MAPPCLDALLAEDVHQLVNRRDRLISRRLLRVFAKGRPWSLIIS
jgi:hypothetical protein